MTNIFIYSTVMLYLLGAYSFYLGARESDAGNGMAFAGTNAIYIFLWPLFALGLVFSDLFGKGVASSE